MANFYLIEGMEASPGDSLAVHGEEAHHMASVARTRVGETLQLGNGLGLRAEGTALEVSPRELRCRVERVWLVPPPPFRLRLAQALAKGDRDELAIQAATELGVDGIVPWQAERSVSRWSGDRIPRGMRRWQTILREATKQSMRAWIPELTAPKFTADLVADSAARGEHIIVLDPGAETNLPDLISGLRAELATGAIATPTDSARAVTVVESGQTPSLLLVVGPEGGITRTESAEFRAAGAVTARLGPNVLRTSTAGPAALAVLGAGLGRWECAIDHFFVSANTPSASGCQAELDSGLEFEGRDRSPSWPPASDCADSEESSEGAP